MEEEGEGKRKKDGSEGKKRESNLVRASFVCLFVCVCLCVCCEEPKCAVGQPPVISVRVRQEL